MEEDRNVDPKLAQLIVPDHIERYETMKLVGAVVFLGLKDQPAIAAAMTDGDKDKLRRSIKQATTSELQRRLEAISIQNPGLLARAMRKCGYKIVERDGNMHIEALDGFTPSQGLVGSYVDYDEFIKEIEEEEK